MIDLRKDPSEWLEGDEPHLEVMDEVFEYVWEGPADELTDDERLARYSHLTDGQKVLMPTFSLHGDVRNGGFGQYFYNCGALFWPECLAGLDRLGAKGHASLLRSAVDAFQDGAVPRNRIDRLIAMYDGDQERLRKELELVKPLATGIVEFSNSPMASDRLLAVFDELNDQYSRLENSKESLEDVLWNRFIYANMGDFVRGG